MSNLARVKVFDSKDDLCCEELRILVRKSLVFSYQVEELSTSHVFHYEVEIGDVLEAAVSEGRRER
jgi:hypothetical protein